MKHSLQFLWLMGLACTPTIDGGSADPMLPSTPSDDDTATAPVSDTLSEIEAAVHDEIGAIIALSWTQSSAAEVVAHYSFDEDIWHQTPASGGSEGSHSTLLLGIPYGSEIAYKLVWEEDSGTVESQGGTISNDPLPDYVPIPDDVDGSADLWDASTPFVFTSMDQPVGYERYVSFIVDREGRVVWSQEVPAFRISLHPRVSHDGTDLLIDHGSFWSQYDGGAASQVQRTKIDGSVVALYDTPGLHHPFTETADGSLVWAAANGRSETLKKLGPDGEIETIFDCRDHFNSIEEYATCGSNTVYWDEERDVFLWSLYSVDTILEIDHQSGEHLQTYGHIAGAWDFDPEDSAFYWQHGAYFLDNGNLLTSCQPDNSERLWVREYERDEETQTLTEVWSFGEDSYVQGSTMGEAHRLPNGNTLHNYGSNARLREVTPEGQVVWDVQWSGSLIARSTPIEDLYKLMP